MSNFNELVMSESIINFAKAMAKFQETVEQPKKDADNPFFKSKYVPIENIVNVVNKFGPPAGLSYTQFPVSPNEKGQPGVVTIVMHSSGEFMQFPALYLPLDKGTAQGIGSTITYARRYSLGAAYGLASEDDDDGNAASGNTDAGNNPPQGTQGNKGRQGTNTNKNNSNAGKGQQGQNKGQSKPQGNNNPPVDDHSQPFPEDPNQQTKQETKPTPPPMTQGQKTQIDIKIAAIHQEYGVPKADVYPRFKQLYDMVAGKEVMPRSVEDITAKTTADKIIKKLDEHLASKQDNAGLPELKKGENENGQAEQKGAGEPKQ